MQNIVDTLDATVVTGDVGQIIDKRKSSDCNCKSRYDGTVY